MHIFKKYLRWKLGKSTGFHEFHPTYIVRLFHTNHLSYLER